MSPVLHVGDHVDVFIPRAQVVDRVNDLVLVRHHDDRGGFFEVWVSESAVRPALEGGDLSQVLSGRLGFAVPASRAVEAE